MLSRVYFWLKLSDVSEVLTASIIRTIVLTVMWLVKGDGHDDGGGNDV
jgi:hypothetical protein